VVAGAGFGGGASGWAFEIGGFAVSALVAASVVAGCTLGDDSDFTGSASVLVTVGRLLLLSLGEDILEVGGEVWAVWVAAAILWGGDVGVVSWSIACGTRALSSLRSFAHTHAIWLVSMSRRSGTETLATRTAIHLCSAKGIEAKAADAGYGRLNPMNIDIVDRRLSGRDAGVCLSKSNSDVKPLW